MKKIFIISFLLVYNCAFAVNIQPIPGENINNNYGQPMSKDWMKPKAGRVMIFDKTQNIAIIGKQTYGLNQNSKIFDGQPKRGSLVKFNVDENNFITDLWIIKQ